MMYNWMGIAGYGLGHWIVFAAMVVLLLYPIGRILMRIGLSPFWAILVFVPVLNLIGLWLLAFINWPGKGSQAFR